MSRELSFIRPSLLPMKLNLESTVALTEEEESELRFVLREYCVTLVGARRSGNKDMEAKLTRLLNRLEKKYPEFMADFFKPPFGWED